VGKSLGEDAGAGDADVVWLPDEVREVVGLGDKPGLASFLARKVCLMFNTDLINEDLNTLRDGDIDRRLIGNEISEFIEEQFPGCGPPLGPFILRNAVPWTERGELIKGDFPRGPESDEAIS